jgi:hypothetical protein
VSEGYRVFGLHVSSEIPLPDLNPAQFDGAADVTIQIGAVPEPMGDEPVGLSVVAEGALLNIPSAGRYWIRDASRIIVAPRSGASPRNIRLFLLGSAFGAVLHLRGLLPLHANAVEIDGRAVAFMGHSGAGKSTLAAWFHDQGLKILSDDVCVVKVEKDRVVAHAGIPRLRLWKDALELTGRSSDGYESSFDDADKFNVPTISRNSSTLELSHVYILNKAQSEDCSFERLQGVAAVQALVENTYRGRYIPMLGSTKEHLMQCLELVQMVPVFDARRVWGIERFDRESELLMAHAKSVLAGT